MRHPTEGVLRRLVDEPAGVADPDRAHVAGCAACLSGLDRARSDATATGAVLTAPPLEIADLDGAWRRISTGAGSGSAVPARHRPRLRPTLRSPLAAALGAVLILGGAGAAAAGDWLPIFRPTHVAALPVTTVELNQLPDLSAYGDVQLNGSTAPERVTDAGAAHTRTGLDVPRVTGLPGGVSGDPTYEVGNQVSATFTFSAAKAAQAAAAAGQPLPSVPAGLAGSRVRLPAGPGVAEIWSQGGAPGKGIPTLVVARLIAPTADSSGVPFDTVRSYLLSLPGISPGLAAQLQAFPADASTLPLPVPPDQVSTRTTDIDGAQATVLSAKDGTMAAVVWVKDGVLTGVGGVLGADEVLTVARGLR